MAILYNATLYAKNQSGDIVEWNIQVQDACTYPSIYITYGLQHGQKVLRETKVKTGKNIGKSNETTNIEQAMLEAEAKVNKKIKEGYRYKIEELSEYRQDAAGNNKPMLAKKFEHGKTSYPAFVQAKLDGVRAELGVRVINDGIFGDKLEVYLLSREGNEYPVPDHIKRDYLNILSTPSVVEAFSEKGYILQNIKLDGEIYNHDLALQEIVSAIKKPNDNTSKLAFVCYDFKLETFQHNRVTLLSLLPLSKSIYPLNTKKVYSDSEVEAFADAYIKIGFEGAIVRDYNATYQFGKRSKYLRKVKRVISKEFELVDIIESGKDNYDGSPIAMFVCRNDVNDLTFKVTPQASKHERYIYLQNRKDYIGKPITVMFRERTKDKIPFHANGIIRDYE